MMPIGIFERSQRPSDRPSSPGMAISRIARLKEAVSTAARMASALSSAVHVVSVRAEILGDGVPEIGLVLHNGDLCTQLATPKPSVL